MSNIAKINNLHKIEKLGRKYINAGHRKRLRDRFLQSGLNGFQDYEIIELLLTLGTPRKDCKQMAKQAIKIFSNLRNVLDASVEELQRVKGIGPKNALGIKLFQEIATVYAKEKISKGIILNSPQKVVDFLRNKIGKEKKEHFLALFLNARGRLIKSGIISIGSLDSSIAHPRDIFEMAIQNHAAQVIITHNHPSGDPEPSENDLVITERLVEAGRILGIEVVDHIIVSDNGFVSLKQKGVIND